MDNLDFLNELYGFSIGDKIIQATAKALHAIINKQTECYGHIYGDRFILLFECKSFDDIKSKRVEFDKVYFPLIETLIDHKVKIVSGAYLIEKQETDIQIILEKVSFAHRTARQNKLPDGGMQRYDTALKRARDLEQEIENKMERALQKKEFRMYLQPKYYLNNEKIAGAEALARWWVDEANIIPPGEFVPVFEKNGFVVKLDMYMFEEACIFMRNMLNQGKNPVVISVNFSRLHLLNINFVDDLCEIADKYQIPHHLLEIELTESAMLDNQDTLMSVLNGLHKKGFTLSMDDFGSGYSSLGLLKDIPINVVKIDRSFFENAEDVERERVVISSVMEMAKRLAIHTVAEGVETKADIDMLKEIGCDIVQGFYYAKPMPFEEFVKCIA